MKKLLGLIGIVFLSAYIFAADRTVDYIGPINLSQNVITTTIAAPGALKKNCLTEFSITVSSSATINFLSGSTTNYIVELATSSPFTSNIALVPVQPFRLTWPSDDPWCADYNQALYFTVLSNASAALPHKVNYRGVIRTNR